VAQRARIVLFKFSTDPLLDAKVRDVVSLYLHPPENAVVVCIDQKSQCQIASGISADRSATRCRI
jgi:hypothetical protein